MIRKVALVIQSERRENFFFFFIEIYMMIVAVVRIILNKFSCNRVSLQACVYVIIES